MSTHDQVLLQIQPATVCGPADVYAALRLVLLLVAPYALPC